MLELRSIVSPKLLNICVISSFVYRKGLIENDFGYATAVGLFNSLVNVILVVSANKISAKLTDTSLW